MTLVPEPDPGTLPLASLAALTKPKVPEWPRYVIGLGVVAYGVMVIAGFTSGSFKLIEPIPLIAILGFVAHRMALRIAERDHDPTMVNFVMAAFAAKMIGTLVRAVIVAVLYNNRSDSLDYHQWGQVYAPMFRSFDFSQAKSLSGTDFMRVMTGVIYSFTGASEVSGAVVMSFLSFVGLLLLWRAFRRAVPDGAHYRYGLLVLFLPSFLYWPSALGKEGFAIFCLGVASYGVARVMTGSIPIGAVLFSAALFGVTLLRPHVAITMFCGVALAAAVGKSSRPSAKSSGLRLVLFGTLVVIGFSLASSTASFFGVPSLNQETVNATLTKAEGRTSDAGSSFTPVTMSNPANAPLAFVTVLFRPFPGEGGSGVGLASSAEGVFLFVLMCRSWRRVLSVPRYMRRRPYVAYCVGIMWTFIFAFSAFSNFGILARQRCQVLPFFLALLCLPQWSREGLISGEEALAARDAPARDPRADKGPDPLSADPAPSDAPSRAAPATFDPYADADLDFDPYERFRRPGDG